MRAQGWDLGPQGPRTENILPKALSLRCPMHKISVAWEALGSGNAHWKTMEQDLFSPPSSGELSDREKVMLQQVPFLAQV